MTKEQILDIFSRLTVEDAAEILANAWQEGRLSEEREEREAWDRYFASIRPQEGWYRSDRAQEADAMLSERRKRFGGGVEITLRDFLNTH